MRWIRDVQVKVFNDTNPDLPAELTIESSQFRIQFDVRNKLADTNGTIGKITVYNLTPGTEGFLSVDFHRCTIEAGYQSSGRGQIFEGSIIRYERGKSGPDRYLTFHLRANGILDQTVMFTLNGEHNHRSVFNTALARLRQIEIQGRTYNIQLEQQGGYWLTEILPKLENFSWTGPVRVLFNHLLKDVEIVRYAEFTEEDRRAGRDAGEPTTYRVSWTLQNETVYIFLVDPATNTPLTREDVGAGIDTFRLSENNGMIGVPEQLETGIRTKTLLQPAIGLSWILEIVPPESARPDGSYGYEGRSLSIHFYEGLQWRVTSLRHSGDSWDGDYFTEIEARGVAPGQPGV